MRTRLLGLLAGTAALALTTAAAQAADLPARVAPPPPIAAVPIFTWTGFYVGAQVGYAFSDSDDNNLFATTTGPFTVNGDVFEVVNTGLFDDEDEDGFTVGGHVGYNFQFGSVVVGAEGDIEWADLGGDNNNNRTITALNGPNAGTTFVLPNLANDIEFIGSLRLRLGFAWDRALIYATGGVAFVSFDDNNAFGFNPPPFFFNNDNSDTEWGWTLGVGVEYAFTNNLTARLEYRYTSFDRNNDNNFFVTPVFNRDDSADFHAVRLGVAYKFGTY
jgi:outer membrane immunogenic protein